VCATRLTQSQYAHQAVVEIIGYQLRYFEEWRLIHIYRAVSLDTIIPGIEYDVHRYITSGLLPFEEFSEEPLWTDEEQW